MDKETEKLYNERAKRVEDAIRLRVPDRVPIIVDLGFFPAKYTGINSEDAFYNPARWKKAVAKTAIDFAPDICSAGQAVSGGALESLGFKQMLWPGYGLPSNSSHQFVEGEYLQADEYDTFLKDPSDFIIRTYLPRIYGKLADLAKLPPMSQLYGYPTLSALLGMPALDNLIEILSKARQEALKWSAEMHTLSAELAELGFPPFTRAATFAPFDFISDRLRGMRGSMLDMYRQPDKILEATERLLPIMLEYPITMAKMTGNTRIFIPMHRGAEGFMSIQQFEKFYWPTFKGLIMGLIDAGLTPCPFFEGDYTSRLEYLLEFPKGKVVGRFDTSDIVKTKEIVGKNMCIQGNVPPSLLQTGTTERVKDYCKNLIDTVGKGGGLIVSPRSSIDQVKPQNLKTMIDTTKEYGNY